MHPALKCAGLTVLLVCSTTIALSAPTIMRSPALAQSITTQDRKAEGDRLFAQGTKQLEQNQNEAAIASFQKALALYRELKERQKEGQTLKSMGNAYQNLKDYARTLEYQQQALAIAREIKDPDLESRVLNNIGLAYRLMGKAEQGMPYLQEAISVARRNQSHFMEALASSNLGRSYADLSKYQEAIFQYEQALEIHRRFLENPEQEVGVLIDLSDTYQALKNYSKMLQPIERAVEISRKLPNQLTLLSRIKLLAAKRVIAAARLTEANLGDSTYQNDPNSPAKQSAQRAIQVLQEALQLSKALKQPVKSEVELYVLLADSYSLAGSDAIAVQHYEQILEFFRQFPDTEPLQLRVLSQLIGSKSITNSRDIEQKKYTSSLNVSNQILELIPQALRLAEELNDLNQQKNILTIKKITYFNIASAYLGLNEFAKAEDTAKTAVETARASKDFKYESKALVVLANVYNSQGEYQKALDTHRRNVEISDQRSPLDEVYALNGFAFTYTLFGDIRKAIELAQQALNKYQTIDPKQLKPDFRPFFWNGRLLLFQFLSSQHEQLGEFDNALKIAQKRVQLASTSGIPQEEAVALIDLGTFYTRRNQLPLALETIQQAEKLLATIKKTIVLSEEDLRLKILLALIEVHTNQGNYAKAWEAARQGLSIANEGLDHQTEIYFLDKIRSLYAAQGNAAKELETLNQSVLLSKRLPNVASRSFSLGDLAVTYATLGNYQISRELLQQSLTEAEKSQVPNYKVLALGQLAQLALFQGNPKEAIAVAERALDATQRRGSIYDVVPLQVAALGYGELGNETMAIAFIQASLKIAQQLQQPVIQKGGLTILGSLHHKFGRFQEAIAAYQSALVAQPNSKDVEIYAGLGRVYTSLNQSATAITFYKQAINGIEQKRQSLQGLSFDLKKSFLDARFGILDVKTADIYRQLADLLITQGRLGEAQQVMELLKVQEINDITNPTRSDTRLTELALNSVEAEIQKRHSDLVAFGQRLKNCKLQDCDSLKRELRQLQQAFDQSMQDIAAKSTSDALMRIDQRNKDFIASASKIVNAQPNTVLIYPLVLSDKVHILWATAGGGDRAVLSSTICPMGEAQLNAKIQQFQTALRSPGSDTQVKALGKELYECLIQPIEEKGNFRANKIQSLVLVPDRTINYIPLAALYDGKQYLIERYTISNALSAELTDVDARLPLNPSVLGFGLSDAYDTFSALSNVPTELNTLVKPTGIYAGSLWMNQKFTRSTLESQLERGSPIVHIATHGEFIPTKPQDSYLLLSSGTPGKGDRYAISQIQFLEGLRQVHLVVLSACETAKGELASDGRELQGISAYFIRGKAKAAIASLWKVNDASTSTLMQQFYQNLATGKMTKAEALRQAQLSLLQGKVPAKDAPKRAGDADINVTTSGTRTPRPANFAHPYYWAPFILIGNSL